MTYAGERERGKNCACGRVLLLACESSIPIPLIRWDVANGSRLQGSLGNVVSLCARKASGFDEHAAVFVIDLCLEVCTSGQV